MQYASDPYSLREWLDRVTADRGVYSKLSNISGLLLRGPFILMGVGWSCVFMFRILRDLKQWVDPVISDAFTACKKAIVLSFFLL